MQHEKEEWFLSTAYDILIDAARNSLTLAGKIFEGKEPEKNEERLKRIHTLRHEIDLCLEEEKFLVSVYDSYQERCDKELKRIDKIIKYAGKYAGNAKEELSELFDADYLEDLVEAARSHVYDLKLDGRARDYEPDYYAPYTVYRQPMSHRTQNWRNLMQGEILMAARAAQEKLSKVINMAVSRVNYEPDAVENVKRELGENVRIYGMYDSSSLQESRDVRSCMERCALGSPEHYKVQNKAFDLIYTRTLTAVSYYSNEGAPASAESPVTKELKRLWRYLAPGGVLLMLVPKFCLRQKERTIASSFYELLGNKRVSTMYENLDMRLLVLRKGVVIEEAEKEATYQKLTAMQKSDAALSDILKHAFDKAPSYDLGSIRLFKGEEQDKLILEIALEKSTLKIGKTKTVQHAIEPLLPLKKGQIGQIIASGRLNGIIDEGDGYKHIISGRVVKGTRRTHKEDYDDPEHAREEDKIIRNNLVEINALGGDGKIRTISMAVSG